MSRNCRGLKHLKKNLFRTAPKALRLYGIEDDEYEIGEKSMYDCIHMMRSRIMTSPKLNHHFWPHSLRRHDKSRGGGPTGCWKNVVVVPILKVDKSLEAEKDGCS